MSNLNNRHLIITGNGKFITPSSKYKPDSFIVPHNFEIIFWPQSGGQISYDFQLNILNNPQSWFDKKSYKMSYQTGVKCPNHLLINGIINHNTSPQPNNNLLLSDIINHYSGSAYNIIVHWCADRSLDWHTE